MALIPGRSGVPQTMICCSFFGRCLLGVLVVLTLMSPLSSVAASTAPPTGENAYCGKGDVPNLERKTGPPNFRNRATTRGWMALPLPGKQIRVRANSDLQEAVGIGKVWRHAAAGRGRIIRDQGSAGKKMRRSALHHDSNRYARFEAASRRNSHFARLGRSCQPPGQADICTTGWRSGETTRYAYCQKGAGTWRPLSLHWAGVGLRSGCPCWRAGYDRGRRPHNFRPQLVSSRGGLGGWQRNSALPRDQIHRDHQFVSQRFLLRGSQRSLHGRFGDRRRKRAKSRSAP